MARSQGVSEYLSVADSYKVVRSKYTSDLKTHFIRIHRICNDEENLPRPVPEDT
jgi:hypothetical protein